jgi:hypothetical protein
MPSGVFPDPQRDRPSDHTVSTCPSLAVRVRTRWRRDRLDDELSQGTDPASSPELSLRSAQLRSLAVRAQLARRLVEALGEARRPAQELSSAKRRRQRSEVRDCADDLLALVQRLQDSRSVEVRGVALTSRLVNDRRGPLYRAGGRDLRVALRSARFALAPTAAGDDLATAA